MERKRLAFRGPSWIAEAGATTSGGEGPLVGLNIPITVVIIIRVMICGGADFVRDAERGDLTTFLMLE